MIYVKNASNIGGHKMKGDSLTTHFWPSPLHNPEDGHQYYVDIVYKPMCLKAYIWMYIFMCDYNFSNTNKINYN